MVYDYPPTQSSTHITVLLIEGLVLAFVFAIFICAGTCYIAKCLRQYHQATLPPDTSRNRRNVKIAALPRNMRIVIDPLGHLLLADIDANSQQRMGGMSSYSATPLLYQMELGSTDAGSINYSGVGDQSYYTTTPVLCQSEQSNDAASETMSSVL